MKEDNIDESTIFILHLQRSLGLRAECGKGLPAESRVDVMKRLARMIDTVDIAGKGDASSGRVSRWPNFYLAFCWFGGCGEFDQVLVFWY